MTTRMIDVHIPVQSQHPDLVTPAFHYLAWIAWPHDSQDGERERFVASLLAAQFKAAGKHLPTTLPPLRGKDIGAAVREFLKRVYKRRQPAVRMVLQHWLRQRLIDVPGLTPAQQERLRGLSATEALIDPDGDLTGQGEPFLLKERHPDNIAEHIWRDSRPALAMMMGLRPLRMAGQGRRFEDLLFDADWVAEAVWDARMFALVIERTIDPPRLLLPRRVEVRGRSYLTRRVPPTQMRQWLGPSRGARVASASEIGLPATPRGKSKSG
jgi:hypothetical protein